MVTARKGPMSESFQEESQSGRKARRVAKVRVLGRDLTKALMKM